MLLELELMMYLLEQAEQLQDQLVAWRRDIHMHPELGFQETRTARLVADTLRDMGLEVEVGVGRTGVVARIGEGEPKVGIRADMDALPIQETNDVPYRSQVDGVMHACGHDAHTAILLGVAKILTEMPDRPDGEFRLLFQPSEEQWGEDGISGASAMIQDNALEDLDHVIALHVSSSSPAGQIEISSGYRMAAVDKFTARIIGKGGHAAAPHECIDPIYIQAQVINAIQAVRSRLLNPLQASVISIGAINGGTAHNIIPGEVQLVGTIRSYKDEVRSFLHEELENALAITRSFGGDYTLEISPGYPATYNDPGVCAVIRSVATEGLGEEHVIEGEPTMGAEDFAYMTQKARGAMLFLGAEIGDEPRPHHNANFDIDESVLYRGAGVLAESACRLLRQ